MKEQWVHEESCTVHIDDKSSLDGKVLGALAKQTRIMSVES